MELYEKYKTLFNSYHVNTPLRISHFMGQIEHESGLKPISENLNYSAKRLREVFPKYFPSIAKANLYANNPMKIGNVIYACRMGNGTEESGEPYKFRGRGFIQITGKSNYIILSKDTRIDFVNNPDLLLTEANSLISALWFFSKHKLFYLADKDDYVGITKSINGGVNGLESRKLLVDKWKVKLGI